MGLPPASVAAGFAAILLLAAALGGGLAPEDTTMIHSCSNLIFFRRLCIQPQSKVHVTATTLDVPITPC